MAALLEGSELMVALLVGRDLWVSEESWTAGWWRCWWEGWMVVALLVGRELDNWMVGITAG